MQEILVRQVTVINESETVGGPEALANNRDPTGDRMRSDIDHIVGFDKNIRLRPFEQFLQIDPTGHFLVFADPTQKLPIRLFHLYRRKSNRTATNRLAPPGSIQRRRNLLLFLLLAARKPVSQRFQALEPNRLSIGAAYAPCLTRGLGSGWVGASKCFYFNGIAFDRSGGRRGTVLDKTLALCWIYVRTRNSKSATFSFFSLIFSDSTARTSKKSFFVTCRLEGARSYHDKQEMENTAAG